MKLPVLGRLLSPRALLTRTVTRPPVRSERLRAQAVRLRVLWKTRPPSRRRNVTS